MKVNVIGANGQLGVDIHKVFDDGGQEVVPLSHNDVGVEDFDQVKRIVETMRPDVVINTSAHHNLDACEKNPNTSFAVNAVGVRNLAILSNEFKFKLVHFSTDYVFDGTKTTPYHENDISNPLNVYGVSKLAGELFIQYIAENYIIIRTSSLFGKNPCRAKSGLNFVKLMLRLASEGKPIQVVNDQFSSPTCTTDLAQETYRMVKNDICGLYHVVSNGGCSWYEFAEEIFRISSVSANLSSKVSVFDPKAIKRPKYSVMSTLRLDIVMPHWKDALKRYLSV
jgi:dTDP-4-dehydrorhamnose reductase